MTAPGSIVTPSPGWWVRAARVGTNSSSYGWAASTGGVPSGEAFGRPTLTPGAVTIHPIGIPSGEAMGTDHFVFPQSIGPAGIASAEAFGTPHLLSALLQPSGIASAEAFGTPKINQKIHTTGIATAEAFGTPKLTLKIHPTGIASAEAFGTPTLFFAPQFDAASVGANAQASSGTGTTLTFNHTLGSGAAAIIVAVHGSRLNEPGSAYTKSVQIGSTNLTLLGSVGLGVSAQSDLTGWLDLFGLAGSSVTALAGTTQTITVNEFFTSASTTLFPVLVAGSASYSGVTTFDTAVTNFGSGTALSTGPVSTTSTSLVVSASSVIDAALSSPSGSSRFNMQTSLGGASAGNGSVMIQDASGASTVTETCTASASKTWGTIAVNMHH